MIITFPLLFLNINTVLSILIAEAYPDAKGRLEESGEIGVEVPEAVTVEVEDIHPLPEVTFIPTVHFYVYLCFQNCFVIKENQRSDLDIT